MNIKKFKDGQVTVKNLENKPLVIAARGSSYEELFAIASAKEAWDQVNKEHNSYLFLTCLIGQRSDRRFEEGSSFDLKVITEFINSMYFTKVGILDPHSYVTGALIENYREVPPDRYVRMTIDKIGKNNLVLVSPDAGAYKKIYKYSEYFGLPLVAANKIRVQGRPVLSINDTNKEVFGKNCLIVDDLADGGRTFKQLAKYLKTFYHAAKVYLYVTHGQFNYGFDELKEYIDGIYCTNSFRDIDDPFVHQFKIHTLRLWKTIQQTD